MTKCKKVVWYICHIYHPILHGMNVEVQRFVFEFFSYKAAFGVTVKVFSH
jgi:hypothetical protein